MRSILVFSLLPVILTLFISVRRLLKLVIHISGLLSLFLSLLFADSFPSLVYLCAVVGVYLEFKQSHAFFALTSGFSDIEDMLMMVDTTMPTDV